MDLILFPMGNIVSVLEPIGFQPFSWSELRLKTETLLY